MKITLNSTIFESIPLLEYFQENITHKGLVFVQHGYQSNKEWGSDYLALHLARMGYFVVAIDAFKHGERIEEPYITGSEKDRLNEAFHSVKRTALDIIKLHHHRYHHFYHFDIIGVSLGGMVAYYLATKTDRIRKLIPVISTPNFITLAYHSVAQAGVDVDTFFTTDKIDFINSINPINRMHKMKYQTMFMILAEKDETIPPQESLIFAEKYKNDSMTVKVYDIDHNVPRKMQLDIFEYIDK